MKAIQTEMDAVNEALVEWSKVDLVVVPLPLTAVAEFIYGRSLLAMRQAYEAGDQETMEHEPVQALTNALSFGMYLGRLGYSEDSFIKLLDTELSKEDERKLLSGPDSGSGIEDTPGETTGTGV
jgi:hypothetical protein